MNYTSSPKQPPPVIAASSGSVNFDALPVYIKSRKQFVMWRYENKGGKKPTKVPYRVTSKRPGHHYAKTNDPATWSDLAACRKALVSGQFDGIGFAFATGDNLTGVDIDNCLDENGQPELWAQKFLNQLSITYIEWSPSLKGYHILCFGKPLATGERKWKKVGTNEDQGIEVYDYTSPRYFTLTGNRVNANEITDCRDRLDWVYQEYYAVDEKHEEPKQARNAQGQVDVEHVRTALSYLSADNRKDWIDYGMACKADGVPLEVWLDWAKTSDKYEPGECEKKWAEFKPDGRIHIGTIFYRAQLKGFKFPAQRTRSSKSEHATETSAWEEDRPLYRELPPPGNFPIDALGDLLGPAVKKCQEVIQAPDSICAGSFLAGLNLAVQAYADIEIDGSRIMPVSEYFVEVAESGDRKTATDNVALASHEAWQQERQENYKREYGYYKADDEVYKERRDKIIKNKQSNDQQRRQELDALKEPDEPLYPLIICSEPTYEGLVKQLANGHPSIGLYSNEGGRFLGGHAMNRDNMLKTATGLSSLWDSGKFDRVRSSDGASMHYGRRLSMHLMIQPDLAPLLFGNRLLVGQGLISRILPAAPLRTDKKYKAIDLSKDPAIIAYSNRITELLNLPLPLRVGTRNSLEPTHLTLSPKAMSGYIKFHDVIQSKLGDGKQLASIRGFGNKAHDHAARIAATIARGSDVQMHTVSLEDFERAVTIVTFAMSELMRIIDASNVSNLLLDAQQLLNWLLLRGEQYVCVREVYQRGPGNVRSARAARLLLEILREHGKVRLTAEKVEYNGSLSQAWEVRLSRSSQECSNL